LNPSILKTERPPVTCVRSNGYYGRPNAPARPASALPRERVRSMALFRPRAVAGLSPEFAPKRTLADTLI
jgi:hypothetical protein